MIVVHQDRHRRVVLMIQVLAEVVVLAVIWDLQDQAEAVADLQAVVQDQVEEVQEEEDNIIKNDTC
jgi:hypothetical protein